ncbi:DNA polymerase eta isoform X2 [Daucus carota subsp. sativus]|uniref:DNA polymerase eta isoform X2 n=1 Tax=Daucus carota subsp. sativus TaxID=79200 RepID=UPI0007F0398D|nr:PREDICTED: DNA polymerase eta isoform X2 [Daucus carota subsp. sativus]
MPVARPESSDSRVIAHVDMDCFYVQVEQRKQPELRGHPTAVVQYNAWKGGGLIAVSYEARSFGVKRSMRGDEAKSVCPEIQLVRVPVARGKADLSIYRNAGSEVVAILSRKGRCERASIDEVYLDLTDAAEKMLSETPPESLEVIDDEVIKSHVLGISAEPSDVRQAVREWICRSNADRRDKLLACGAFIVAELRMQVLKETQFSCSAGIAHNKMLAKLASGMNKPAQQTVVPFVSIKSLLEPLPIRKMKQLGGKLGCSLQDDLGVNTVGDLLQFSEGRLQERYGINTGTWLWNIARGINGDEVESRVLPKSHGTGKTFPGLNCLKTIAAIERWLSKFSEELAERLEVDLEQNKRIAQTLTLHASAHKATESQSQKKFPSKSCPLRYGTTKILEDALNLFQAGLREYLSSSSKAYGNGCSGWGITNLSLSASKIVDIPSGTCSIMKYFHTQDQSCSSTKEFNDKEIFEAATLSTSGTCAGSESYLMKHLQEPQTECHEDGTKMNTLMQTHLEDESRMFEDKAQTNFSREISSLSTPVKKNEPQLDSVGEDAVIKDAAGGNRSRDQKGKALKEKGTSSILQFFQTKNCFQEPKEESVNDMQETTESSCSGKADGTVPSESGGIRSLHRGADQSRVDCIYKIDEIDPNVVDELPREIQEEVRAWLRPQKRANNTMRRGSSITHYFSPNKNL